MPRYICRLRIFREVEGPDENFPDVAKCLDYKRQSTKDPIYERQRNASEDIDDELWLFAA